MRVLLSILLFLGAADAVARDRVPVTTPAGFLVESFGDCPAPICPAVVILSGSRGFGAPVYDEIGERFRAAGLNAYLVHVLSAADLEAIAAAGGAPARIAYYARRMPEWIAAVHEVVAHLEAQPRHGGRVGVLGISLGAQIASAAAADRSGVDALVLVDGGLPNGHSRPIRSLPPLLLLWGSDDGVFPVAVAHALVRKAQGAGAPAALEIYEGGAHDFFLRSNTPNAVAAHRRAAAFLASRLSGEP